ncbi:ATP-binding protein [Psychromonas sp. SP041]|uniref:ATP-binding protein n=1 Tax=Psychromonas sp. SP041 TaxID=1365007 RepID=UPI0010C7DC78|nr:ATP-binding protein [Psychromonas sp. SP041]
MNNLNAFSVDDSVIKSFIFSQNGTLATGLRELVINGIDKGSETIEVNISQDGFEVIDHGEGFDSVENIKKHFGRFGTPHVEGDAKFGLFRIGRGQIMKFGEITWLSNEFRIHTDVNNLNMGYQLESGIKKKTSGCIVKGKLYNPLSKHELISTINQLEDLVFYLSNDVVINKKLSSGQMNDTDWDYEDEKVKIKWSNSGYGIRIYSQGAYVKTIRAYEYGSLNADVVSKENLVLNMARNEISDDDELWIHISSVVRKKAYEEARKKIRSRRLDDYTRGVIIRGLMSKSDEVFDVFKYGLIKDYKGRAISINSFSSSKLPLTIVEKSYESYAEAISMQKVAFVLSYSELEKWGVSTVPDFVRKISTICTIWGLRRSSDDISNKVILPIELLSKGLDDSISTIGIKDLTSRQSAARESLIAGSKVAAREFSKLLGEFVVERKILIGRSIRSISWTDGLGYIAFNEDILTYLDSGIEGATEMALILCNEYTHTSSNLETYPYELVFYEDFHNRVLSSKKMILGKISDAVNKAYFKGLIKRSQAVPNKAISQIPVNALMMIYDYQGELMGNAKLSDLFAIICKYYSISFKSTKKKISLSINSDVVMRKCTHNTNIMNHLLGLASKEGLSTSKDILITDSYTDVHNKNVELLLRWGKTKGHDLNILTQISTNSFMMTPTLLCYLFCLDVNSNVNSLTRYSFVNERTVVTKSGSFKNYGVIYTNERNIEPGLSDNIDKIEDEVLNQINKIMNGVKDPEIKKRVTEKLLSKEAEIRLTRFY